MLKFTSSFHSNGDQLRFWGISPIPSSNIVNFKAPVQTYYSCIFGFHIAYGSFLQSFYYCILPATYIHLLNSHMSMPFNGYTSIPNGECLK